MTARKRLAPPLFLQLLVALLAGLVAAQALSLVVVSLLPPPRLDRVGTADVAAALRAPELYSGALHVNRRVAPPGGDKPAHPHEAMLEAALADALDVPVGTVRVRGLARGRPGGPFGPPPGVGRPGPAMSPPPARAEGPRMPPAFEAGVLGEDGRWTVARSPGLNGHPAWLMRVALWFLACAVALTPIAWLAARRLTAPIKAFASAAERLGRDPAAPAMAPQGPPELDEAVASFNVMQVRLQRFVQDRTAMIGAVAHDLRTPLMRMRFHLDRLPDADRARLTAEVDEMDAMLGEALAFVKEASRPQVRELVDLGSVAERVCADMADTGAPATYVEGENRLIVWGDPLALRRMLTNLISNAVAFGEAVEVSAAAEDGEAVVRVDDSGPGLPPEELERVFEPFHRVESSRSRDTGGVGLGLASARTAARAHGGDIRLENRARSGLRATVSIPLAAR